MRSILSSSAAAAFIGALFIFGESSANPVGVPLPNGESPPLSCQTADFSVVGQQGPGGEFPKAVTVCGGTAPCWDYHYKVSATLNIDHTVFAVSATQDLFSTSPTATVASPGAGDSATGFLAFALHEYPVRFNSANTKSVEAHIYISGNSKPRISTVLVRSGTKRTASCLIAGPGVVAGDVFQPVFQSQTSLVAGGRCVANLVFDTFGNVVDVTTSTPGCRRVEVVGDLLVNGQPLRNNSGPHGITYGNGTKTCYGPKIPNPPKCICSPDEPTCP